MRQCNSGFGKFCSVLCTGADERRICKWPEFLACSVHARNAFMVHNATCACAPATLLMKNLSCPLYVLFLSVQVVNGNVIKFHLYCICILRVCVTQRKITPLSFLCISQKSALSSIQLHPLNTHTRILFTALYVRQWAKNRSFIHREQYYPLVSVKQSTEEGHFAWCFVDKIGSRLVLWKEKTTVLCLSLRMWEMKLEVESI